MDVARRNKPALVVIILGAFMLMMMRFPGALPDAVAQVATGNNGTQCTEEIKYYAYDAPAGSNQFGPNQDFTSVTDAQKRFDEKLCKDPLFTAAIAAFEVQGAQLDPSVVMATAKKIAGDKQAWKDMITAIKDQVASYSVENVNATYETLAMLPGSKKTDMPSLIKLDRPVKLGYALTLHMKDGTKRHLRIICDLQPAEPRFPKVSPPPVKPPTAQPQPPGEVCKVNCTPPPPPPPGCKVNCTPPPVCQVNCSPSKPPQTKDCMLNGGPGCPPNGGNQPPQHNPGQNTGPTQNAPSSAPSPAPTGPKPQPSSSAPPPNSGGNNSGSGNGSGTPQGSECNNGQCNGGGPSDPSPGPTDEEHSEDENSGGSSNPSPPPG